MNLCRICSQLKSENYFYKGRKLCKDCHNSATNKWRKENPEKAKIIRAKWYHKNKVYHKEYHLKNEYNVSLELYNKLVKNQDFKCLICKHESVLEVDHCHKTGKIRGLLCHQCNVGLGYFKDNIDNLIAAQKYLETNNEQNS